MIHEWMGMWDAWTCEHRIQSILSDDKWIHGYVSMWPHIVPYEMTCAMHGHLSNLS